MRKVNADLLANYLADVGKGAVRALSDTSKVSEQTIVKMARGKYNGNLKLVTRRQISKATGLNEDELFPLEESAILP